MAQWIRHLTTNQGIPGSNPSGIGIFFFFLLKRTKTCTLYGEEARGTFCPQLFSLSHPTGTILSICVRFLASKQKTFKPAFFPIGGHRSGRELHQKCFENVDVKLPGLDILQFHRYSINGQ